MRRRYERIELMTGEFTPDGDGLFADHIWAALWRAVNKRSPQRRRAAVLAWRRAWVHEASGIQTVDELMLRHCLVPEEPFRIAEECARRDVARLVADAAEVERRRDPLARGTVVRARLFVVGPKPTPRERNGGEPV